jgi:hypothetical protein
MSKHVDLQSASCHGSDALSNVSGDLTDEPSSWRYLGTQSEVSRQASELLPALSSAVLHTSNVHTRELTAPDRDRRTARRR